MPLFDVVDVCTLYEDDVMCDAKQDDPECVMRLVTLD